MKSYYFAYSCHYRRIFIQPFRVLKKALEIDAFDEKKPDLGVFGSGFKHTVRQFGAYDIVR